MVTPPSTEQELLEPGRPGALSKKRAPPDQESSASTVLKKGKPDQHNMKRTPQPNLTQSKLTSMLQPSTATAPASATMDVTSIQPEGSAPAHAAPKLGGPGEALTADFFRNLIGENTATITAKLDKVTGDLAQLSGTVDSSKKEIAAVTAEVERHSSELTDQRTLVEELADRVARLENGGGLRNKSCTLSPAYLHARRSVRMWPIENANSKTLWKGVGEFLHSALGIPESDIGPEDIEEVVALPEHKYTAGNISKEALVTFFCPRKRDIVVSSSPNLSNLMENGVPTAGLRLEIPEELMGQFRLLSRFGTRLRARHGAGTKRHVKFDDVDGSLFMNIKLPGDESWSRITVETARIDLDRTSRDESAKLLKRIHAKPLPTRRPMDGPRERLAVAAPSNTAATSTRPSQDGRNPSAQRPRTAWIPREDRV